MSSQSQCASSRPASSPIPSPPVATVVTMGGFQSSSARSASAIMLRRSRTVSWACGRSALLTTNTSAISRMPALAACTASPIPGTTSTATESAIEVTSTSTWPTPTVSIRTMSKRAASRARITCGVAAASPPRWPRLAIDRMNTSGSVACSCIRTRSPSSAPPVNGDVGSTASTPTRRPRPR